MITFFPVKLAAALSASLLLLAACSEMQPSSSGPAPETGTALPPPEPGENTQVDALQAPLPQAETSGEASEVVIIQGPDGTTWRASRALDEEAYQVDVDDCFRYASAQTRNDARIIDDRNAGIDTLTSDSRYSGLRKRVDEFDLRNRRKSLMSSCMESKGYARADNVLPRLEF